MAANYGMKAAYDPAMLRSGHGMSVGHIYTYYTDSARGTLAVTAQAGNQVSGSDRRRPVWDTTVLGGHGL